MYNKRKFNKINDKKVLHKVKKQWVTVSLALFLLIGGSSVIAHVNANADTTNQEQTTQVQPKLKQQNVTAQANQLHNKLVNNTTKTTLRLGSYHGKNTHAHILKARFKRSNSKRTLNKSGYYNPKQNNHKAKFIFNKYAPNDKRAVVPRSLNLKQYNWVKGFLGQTNPTIYKPKYKGWLKLTKYNALKYKHQLETIYKNYKKSKAKSTSKASYKKFASQIKKYKYLMHHGSRQSKKYNKKAYYKLRTKMNHMKHLKTYKKVRTHKHSIPKVESDQTTPTSDQATSNGPVFTSVSQSDTPTSDQTPQSDTLTVSQPTQSDAPASDQSTPTSDVSSDQTSQSDIQPSDQTPQPSTSTSDQPVTPSTTTQNAPTNTDPSDQTPQTNVPSSDQQSQSDVPTIVQTVTVPSDNSDQATPAQLAQYAQQMKQQTLADINKDRQANGVAPLVENPTLDKLANIRAQQLLTDFSHYNSQNQFYGTLDAPQVGLPSNFECAENISGAGLGNMNMYNDPKNYDNKNGYDMANMAEDAMMNYDQDQGNGHRDNILDPTSNYVGIGVSYTKDGSFNLSEDFGSNDPDSSEYIH